MICQILGVGDINLQLSEILQIKSLNTHFMGDENVLNRKISGVSIDSRTIKPNELFFALHGENFDAHKFIPQVLKKHAIGVVVNQKWYNNSYHQYGNFIIVEDTLMAFQEASLYYRSKFDFPIIAITGSNGKTTTKEMVADVLSKKYRVSKNRGNLNNHVGVPLTLFEFIDAYNLAVIEFGANHFGEIKRLAEIAQPDYGLITNIGPAHLEFFGSIEGVARAKFELWDFLVTNNGIAFVNMDDNFLTNMIPNVKKVITYGFNQQADIKGEYLGVNEFGNAHFKVMDTVIELKVAGMHNIYNALAAVAVALEFNLNMNQIKIALENFLTTDKRMEVIRKQGITIINDCYNSNLISAEKSLITLSQMKTNGRRIAVLADMLELGQLSEPHHRKIGEIVTKLAIDYLLAFGHHSKFTIDQARNSGLKKAIHFEFKEELIHFLKKLIQQNDVILVKGSRGMVMEEVTEAICNTLILHI